MITDSHCHLTCDELYEQADALIENALAAGVDKMLVMCTSQIEFERALALKEKYPALIDIGFGYHPQDVQEITEEDFLRLEKAAMEHQIDVLGEIGLDYHWDTEHKKEQKELFARQLKLAEKASLPVSIHMRDATKDTCDLILEYARTPVILHCYSGSKEIMEQLCRSDLDIVFSFAGPVTFKNNRSGVENVKACEENRILSETDSPYLAPVPHRGKQNQPAYTADTVKFMAQLRETDVPSLAKRQRQRTT
jgi:TatD DNase family protein